MKIGGYLAAAVVLVAVWGVCGAIYELGRTVGYIQGTLEQDCAPSAQITEVTMGQGQGKSEGKGTESAAGQQKLHRVRQADGSIVEMSQADWKARDKSAGLVRVDEDGAEIPETPEGEEPADSSTQG